MPDMRRDPRRVWVMVVSSPCSPEGTIPFLRTSIRSGRVDPSIVVIYADVDNINIPTGR